ncbi:hypothetical protein Mapa_018584 [Marchantia paleacea]|nr:hypothetical protein Mapa_018584 [Marchantia paleacea]
MFLGEELWKHCHGPASFENPTLCPHARVSMVLIRLINQKSVEKGSSSCYD